MEPASQPAREQFLFVSHQQEQELFLGLGSPSSQEPQRKETVEFAGVVAGACEDHTRSTRPSPSFHLSFLVMENGTSPLVQRVWDATNEIHRFALIL